eukprot:TRINITY_DN1182_c0_g1_i2.p1 TRINITY_DN1182_c0_g1~~TRINITY_DN1182_c0_g1_i2.p1  ORF type:complete len:563 (-),score=136.65 TRINITY_DN1182_c0_g1_i2:135-1823(-)
MEEPKTVDGAASAIAITTPSTAVAQPPQPITTSSTTTTSPDKKGSATNVYIHSLPLDITDEKLHQIFGAYGDIESARVMVDFNTRASRGYGFVKFKNSDAATKAIAGMNGSEMNGKTLVVKQANDDANGGTPSNNVYLKGLPITVTVEQLTEVFSHFGPITECRILTDAATKISRGQALVRFDSVPSASQAVQSYNNAPFPVQGNLKVMTVKFADNEEEKAERKAKLKKKMSASGGRFGLSSSGILSSSGGFSNSSPQIYSPYHSQFYGDAPYYAGLNASGQGNALHGSGMFTSGGLGASGGFSASSLGLGSGVNVVNPAAVPSVVNPSAGVNVVSPLNTSGVHINTLRTSGGFHTSGHLPLPVQPSLHSSGTISPIPVHPLNPSALRTSAGITPTGSLVTSTGAAAAGATAPPVVSSTTNNLNTSSSGISPLVVSSGITHSQGLLYASGGISAGGTLSASGNTMTPPPGFSSSAPHNDPNVYVYHLPAETEDVHLLQRFAKYGPVQSVKVIRDPISGLCRGFGFIRYASMDAAYQAIASENGQRLGAKVLSVTLAKQKTSA